LKTVIMDKTFDYKPRSGVIIVYRGGKKYRRVPEAAVRKIVEAKAGVVQIDKPVS
jgi:(2Fe-2S) ferredoxin